MRLRRTAALFAALGWLATVPAEAPAGYDIAHIVERTCEPGGPLVVTDKWKAPRDRDRVVTEPGEVVDCPPLGPKDSFQIAAGPEGIGGDPFLCVYFSLFNGDGADVCLTTDSVGGQGSFVEPLMAIQTDQSGRLEVAGLLSGDVTEIRISPAADSSAAPTVVLVDAERAAGLGAANAFSIFSLTTSREALCVDEPPRLLAFDSMDRPVDEAALDLSTSLLSTDDGVPFDRSLKALCGSSAESEPIMVEWLAAISGMLRSVFGALVRTA